MVTDKPDGFINHLTGKKPGGGYINPYTGKPYDTSQPYARHLALAMTRKASDEGSEKNYILPERSGMIGGGRANMDENAVRFIYEFVEYHEP